MILCYLILLALLFGIVWFMTLFHPGERKLGGLLHRYFKTYLQVAEVPTQQLHGHENPHILDAKKTQLFGPRKEGTKKEPKGKYSLPTIQTTFRYFQSPEKISPEISAWKRKHASLRPQPPCGQGFTAHGLCISQKSKVSTHNFPANCSKHTSCLAFRKNLTSHTTSWDTKNYHILKEFKPSCFVSLLNFQGVSFPSSVPIYFMNLWNLRKSPSASRVGNATAKSVRPWHVVCWSVCPRHST